MKICLENVTKAYGSLTVIRNYSETIAEGEAVAVTGPSGIGKTTLMRLVLGLTLPDSGKVLACGEKQTFSPEPRKPLHAGCVFQEDRLLPDCSAVENLRAVRAGSEREIREALKKILPEESLQKPVRELSGGMRRRVCLARACLSDAKILVMDEPFAGLDEDTREKAVHFLQEYRRERTLILAVHSMESLGFCREIRLREAGSKE